MCNLDKTKLMKKFRKSSPCLLYNARGGTCKGTLCGNFLIECSRGRVFGFEYIKYGVFPFTDVGMYPAVFDFSELEVEIIELKRIPYCHLRRHSATIGPGGLPAAIRQIEGFSHFRMPFVCL